MSSFILGQRQDSSAAPTNAPVAQEALPAGDVLGRFLGIPAAAAFQELIGTEPLGRHWVLVGVLAKRLDDFSVWLGDTAGQSCHQDSVFDAYCVARVGGGAVLNFCRDRLAPFVDALARQLVAVKQADETAPLIVSDGSALSVSSFEGLMRAANGWGDVFNRLRDIASTIDTLEAWKAKKLARAAAPDPAPASEKPQRGRKKKAEPVTVGVKLIDLTLGKFAHNRQAERFYRELAASLDLIRREMLASGIGDLSADEVKGPRRFSVRIESCSGWGDVNNVCGDMVPAIRQIDECAPASADVAELVAQEFERLSPLSEAARLENDTRAAYEDGFSEARVSRAGHISSPLGIV